MKHVLSTHDPPFKRVTLKGHFEDIYSLANRIRDRCQVFVAEELLSEIQDDDVVEITFVLFRGHPLTKETITLFKEENGAESVRVAFNKNIGGSPCR